MTSTTHTPEWLRTHQFTAEDINNPGGRGLAYVAENFYNNGSARTAIHAAARNERIARLQHEAEAEAALAAQQQAGGS